MKKVKVIITGCSSGIGKSTALFLREKGWEVFPTARKDDDVKKLCQEGFNAYKVDLKNTHEIEIAVKHILEISGGEMHALINNAGFALRGAIEDLTIDDLRNQFDVNLFGVHEITKQLIPVFKQQKFGRIINISSIVAMVPFPFLGAYSASKSALEAWSDALHNELLAHNIYVTVVQPGPILTKFQYNTEKTLERFNYREHVVHKGIYNKINKQIEGGQRFTQGSIFALPPTVVSRKIWKNLLRKRPKRRIQVTLLSHILSYYTKYLPLWCVDRMSQKYLNKITGDKND